MTSLVAAMRPDDWNFPLLLHVAGASFLVGSVGTAATAALVADRTAQPDFMRRLAFRSLLLAALPAYILMRIGGEWIRSKEFGDTDEDPAWLGIGYITADLGLLVLLVTLVLAGIATRKSQRGLGRASGLLGVILVVAWLVAVWAMGAKPD